MEARVKRRTVGWHGTVQTTCTERLFEAAHSRFYGTVYKAAPDGTETVLYSFPGKYPYGNNPILPVVLDSHNNAYGVTTFSDKNLNVSGGATFSVTPAGKFTVRFQFCSLLPCPNGDGPSAMILDKAGTFTGPPAEAVQ